MSASNDHRPPIHASNAWNPTGQTLLPVPGCRLYFHHCRTLSGERTQVFLGTQQHLTFAADLEGHVPVSDLRDLVITTAGLYPHLVDLEPAPPGTRP